MNNIQCILHRKLANQICLNRECLQKKIACPDCLTLSTSDDNDNPFRNNQQPITCLEDHKEDVLIISDFHESKFNSTYQQIRSECLKDDQYIYRSISNLNRFKFENLGRDFYYFLQDQADRGIRNKSMNHPLFHSIISDKSSQIKFSQILNLFSCNLLENQNKFHLSCQSKDKQHIELQKEQKLLDIEQQCSVDSEKQKQSSKIDQQQFQIDEKYQFEQIIELERQATRSLSDNLEQFNKDLYECQEIFENCSTYQENFTDQEIDGLLKKLKKIISEFVDKKIKKKQKKKIPYSELSKIDCKQLNEESLEQNKLSFLEESKIDEEQNQIYINHSETDIQQKGGLSHQNCNTSNPLAQKFNSSEDIQLYSSDKKNKMLESFPQLSYKKKLESSSLFGRYDSPKTNQESQLYVNQSNISKEPIQPDTIQFNFDIQLQNTLNQSASNIIQPNSKINELDQIGIQSDLKLIQDDMQLISTGSMQIYQEQQTILSSSKSHSIQQIQQDQKNIQSGGSSYFIPHNLFPTNLVSKQEQHLLKSVNEIDLKGKNKIYRIRVSKDEKQISLTCGGWVNGSGNCMLYHISDENSSQSNNFYLRKTLSYANYKFVDSAFTPSADYLCLTSNQKVCIYSTDFYMSPNNKSYVDKTPFLKISTTFDVRAIEIYTPQSYLQTSSSSSAYYLLGLGGNQYFEVLKLSQDMKEFQSLMITAVGGQIENIKCCFENKYFAFTVYETQQICLYEIEENQICYMSEPLGFELWYMEIEEESGCISVSGEHSCIHLFSLHPTIPHTLQPHSLVQTLFNSVITSFTFFHQYLLTAGSDNTFKIYQNLNQSRKDSVNHTSLQQITGDNLQSKYTISNSFKNVREYLYKKIYQSDQDLHIIPTLGLCNKRQQLITGCQKGKLIRWQLFLENIQYSLQLPNNKDINIDNHTNKLC